MAEETMDEVWRFQKWDEILARCRFQSIKGDIPALRSDTQSKTPRKRGWSTEPESAAHQALKKWVAENPRVLGTKISRLSATLQALAGLLGVRVVVVPAKRAAKIQQEIRPPGTVPSNGLGRHVTGHGSPRAVADMAESGRAPFRPTTASAGQPLSTKSRP
jgi:hypothetical protein